MPFWCSSFLTRHFEFMWLNLVSISISTSSSSSSSLFDLIIWSISSFDDFSFCFCPTRFVDHLCPQTLVLSSCHDRCPILSSVSRANLISSILNLIHFANIHQTWRKFWVHIRRCKNFEVSSLAQLFRLLRFPRHANSLFPVWVSENSQNTLAVNNETRSWTVGLSYNDEVRPC